MKTAGFLGFVYVALAMFALPAAAQTSGGTTPASEGMCDELADKTPGLYGLCVAMCEAQACKAQYNRFTEQVDFDPGCNPSSDELLANYMKLADPTKGDPPVPPCVDIACPCWTEAEIENIGGLSDTCILGDSQAILSGSSTDGDDMEWAIVDDHPVDGLICRSILTNPATDRTVLINGDEFKTCHESVEAQCESRPAKTYHVQ